MPRLKKSKRGQATAIGAILFFTIAMVLIGFLYEVYNTQAVMNQFDSERSQERIAISDALFGDTQTYSKPNSTAAKVSGTGSDPFSGVRSKNAEGSSFIIPNMNFTDSADGWMLTRKYYGAATTGASGGFTLDTPSPGGIFLGFSHTPPVGEISGVIMNWTTRFYVDVNTIGLLNKVFLSYRSYAAIYAGVSFSKIGIFLENTTKGSNRISERTLTQIDVGWTTRGGIRIDPKNFTQSGWYKLIIKVQAELAYLTTKIPEIKILFDDVGIRMDSSIYITNWHGNFTINQDPSLITQLDVQYTGHYEDSSALLKEDSILMAGSTIMAGSSISFGADYTLGPYEDFTTGTIDSTLKAGSILKAGSTLKLSSNFTLGTTTDVEIKTGAALKVKQNSVISENSILAGTRFDGTSDITISGVVFTYSAVSKTWSNKVADLSVNASSGDIIKTTSTLEAYSVLTLLNDETITADMVIADSTTLKGGSTIMAGSAVSIGSKVFRLAGDITTGTIDTTLSTKSVLAANTVLRAGSYYYYDPGTGSIKVEITATKTLALDVTVTTPSFINQYIYILNVVEGRWELLDKSSASTLTKTVKKTVVGLSVQNYITSYGDISVSIYSFSSDPFNCVAEQLTISDFYTGTTDKITLIFTNTGGINVRITSLWIVDPNNNHYHYDLNLPLSPGETRVQIIDQRWFYGGYVFKAITDKGTMAKYEETA